MSITFRTMNSKMPRHPSVLWRCWLGGRKGIRPVKNWVVGCWHGWSTNANVCIWLARYDFVLEFYSDLSH